MDDHWTRDFNDEFNEVMEEQRIPERRTWLRLTDPPEAVRTVRQTGGSRCVWTRIGESGHYWATDGWESGVDWAQVLRWGEVEDITDESQDGGS